MVPFALTFTLAVAVCNVVPAASLRAIVTAPEGEVPIGYTVTLSRLNGARALNIKPTSLKPLLPEVDVGVGLPVL
ncbi:hypothetical protein D3C87_2163510 [compost metagenome]